MAPLDHDRKRDLRFCTQLVVMVRPIYPLFVLVSFEAVPSGHFQGRGPPHPTSCRPRPFSFSLMFSLKVSCLSFLTQSPHFFRFQDSILLSVCASDVVFLAVTPPPPLYRMVASPPLTEVSPRGALVESLSSPVSCTQSQELAEMTRFL